MEILKTKIVRVEIHAWSTEFTLESDDCKAYSPEILVHKMQGMLTGNDAYDMGFVICKEKDLIELQNKVKQLEEDLGIKEDKEAKAQQMFGMGFKALNSDDQHKVNQAIEAEY